MTIDYPFDEHATAVLTNDRLKGAGLMVGFSPNVLVSAGSATLVNRIEIPDSETDKANEILSIFGLLGKGQVDRS